MFVCLCNGLTERRVREAIADGARTHDDVHAWCGCTAQCYSCAAEIDAMIAAATPTSAASPSPVGGSSRDRAT